MVTMANEKIVRRISISTGSMIWLLFLADPDRGGRPKGYRDHRPLTAKLESSKGERAKTHQGPAEVPAAPASPSGVSFGRFSRSTSLP